MNPQIPPTDDDTLSPDERELAQLYGRLSQAEPDAKLDAAILAQAQAAVQSKPGRARRRWSVGFASAAALVLAVGIVWRSNMLPAPESSLVSAASSSADKESGAPAMTPVAPGAQATARNAPAEPSARMTARAEKTMRRISVTADTNVNAAPPPARYAPPPPVPAPKVVEMVSPPPPAMQQAMSPPLPQTALTAPPAPPLQAGDQAPSPASSVMAKPDGTPAQRIAYIRRMLGEDHRTQASDAMHALRKDFPNYAIPDDLRALQSH